MIARFAVALWGLCLLFIHDGIGQHVVQRTPEKAARAIIERIVRETSFELRPVPQKPALDIQVVDFGQAFGHRPGGIGFALSSICLDKDTTIAFGISYGIPLAIRLNDSIVFTAKKPSRFVFKEIGYGIFRFNDTLRLSLKEGANSILLMGELSTDHNAVYLRELQRPGRKTYTRFDLARIDTGFRGNVWMYAGLFKRDGSHPFESILPPESGFGTKYSYNGDTVVWRSLPTQMLKEFVVNPDAVYRRESHAEWQYSNGTVMLSLLEFAKTVNDSAIMGFVERFCNFTVDNQELFRRQYELLHAFRGSNHRLFRLGMLDDTGAPALPFVELLLANHDRRLEPIAANVARTIMNEQLRLADGTFCRYESSPGTVWADDLFMSAPFLVRMGRYTGEKRYYDDAARQVVNFNKYLQDTLTGLYRHGWYNPEKRQSPVTWGRANGWVVWATSEVIRFLPPEHPLREEIVKIYRDHMKAIVSYQASSGLWHQVLDRPDSFEETSCTAMFLIGLARGMQSGILDEGFHRPLKNAWQGLQTRISNDGIVKDICRGTEMSDEYEFYFARERFPNDPRGLGAVIAACTEMIRFDKYGHTK